MFHISNNKELQTAVSYLSSSVFGAMEGKNSHAKSLLLKDFPCQSTPKADLITWNHSVYILGTTKR